MSNQLSRRALVLGTGAGVSALALSVARTASCGPSEFGWVSGSTGTKIPRIGFDRGLVAFYAGGQRAVVAVGSCGEPTTPSLVTQSTSTKNSVLVAGGSRNPGKVIVGYATVDRDN
ncbi:hypothetical protein [Aestuariimicrobium ganziense]|uniref:hypothetical protein n=1 Tax=Aestuariimicrobium ganziense TaxID=2773677 RepID=UPI001942A077|nr:hypothetical protein [Aestuariimicrobium ganziense]